MKINDLYIPGSKEASVIFLKGELPDLYDPDAFFMDPPSSCRRCRVVPQNLSQKMISDITKSFRMRVLKTKGFVTEVELNPEMVDEIAQP